MSFNFTGNTVFVECAFGHSGKDEDHRVYSIFLIAFHEGDHVDAESQECAVKESIHQEHLTCKIKISGEVKCRFTGFTG